MSRKNADFLQSTHVMILCVNSFFKISQQLRHADIVPARKTKSKLSKENYRSISILPNIYKIYERCLYDQIATYFEKIFSKYHCGFRKSDRLIIQ